MILSTFSLKTYHGCPVILLKLHLLVSTNNVFPPHPVTELLPYTAHVIRLSNNSFLRMVSDFGHPGEWPVGGHDSQGEAAALVPEDDRWLPEHPL